MGGRYHHSKEALFEYGCEVELIRLCTQSGTEIRGRGHCSTMAGAAREPTTSQTGESVFAVSHRRRRSYL